MTINLRDLAKVDDLLAGGHRACAGCPAPIAMRTALRVAGPDTVVSFATGCMEVVTTIYPFTAWKVPYIHSAFANSAATMSGVVTAYEALKKQGKITKDLKFLAWGGDGGTYDIGLQSLSGALERGHNFTYICYDNEGYMNTGIQRSGSTPRGAETNTSPVGSVQQGKPQGKKDLTAIATAHKIPYVAQAAVYNLRDFASKVEKAINTPGACFINVLAPCHRGWRVMPNLSVEFTRKAVNTCTWPLFEIENGVFKLNYKPKEKLPVEEYLKDQGRFKHLFKGENGTDIIKEIQADVDNKWEFYLERDGERFF